MYLERASTDGLFRCIFVTKKFHKQVPCFNAYMIYICDESSQLTMIMGTRSVKEIVNVFTPF